MNDFEDIKQLWDSNNTLDMPNLEQTQTVIKKYQSKKKQNAFLVTILFILCGIAFVLIIILHNPSLWTTTVGEILILIGFISGIILKLKTLKSISKNELKSNKDFLEDLIKIGIQNKTKLNWHLIISVLLLVIGYGFFIYEKIKENKTELILSYLGIALFTLGMYFIFRPFVRKISNNKVEKMIEAIKPFTDKPKV
jgi:1,4-dihydroxy-2-naphthoate octaprenyltransferase